MRLDFNEDSPKRNAVPRRAAMVAQTHLMQQATARDVFVLVLSQSRWKMSKSAGGGDNAVMYHVDSWRDYRLKWWHDPRVMSSNIGAFATNEVLASAPG
ncbi:MULTISPECIES: hypothetical protein [Stenotrophomonas]|uniref:hypothetical protein n=1 Tax=Stenotrophomonas TaxID=40323 RepID=UPI00128BCB49|nr:MULTISPECIES: hypothetical protein [Stenotrophomonas]MBH1410564.1 hypothetical protein [Stenotrophomonas maltophilia]MDH1390345.1 hypothetical protein [Stenotrophomonas sp. GD03701]MDH1394414.1 hypothetical protein [Stenotrophomonas sp. GD03702]MDQ7304165.1 hypothetical protein [Stenotrophomonas sp. Sm0581]HDS1300570.1 hypothetical protein [Stenotrophomonas maltophilia]